MDPITLWMWLLQTSMLPVSHNISLHNLRHVQALYLNLVNQMKQSLRETFDSILFIGQFPFLFFFSWKKHFTHKKNKILIGQFPFLVRHGGTVVNGGLWAMMKVFDCCPLWRSWVRCRFHVGGEYCRWHFYSPPLPNILLAKDMFEIFHVNQMDFEEAKQFYAWLVNMWSY